LSGIGAMLAVMTQRLARVIDRARTLEQRLEAHPGDATVLHKQLATLSRLPSSRGARSRSARSRRCWCAP